MVSSVSNLKVRGTGVQNGKFRRFFYRKDILNKKKKIAKIFNFQIMMTMGTCSRSSRCLCRTGRPFSSRRSSAAGTTGSAPATSKRSSPPSNSNNNSAETCKLQTHLISNKLEYYPELSFHIIDIKLLNEFEFQPNIRIMPALPNGLLSLVGKL